MIRYSNYRDELDLIAENYTVMRRNANDVFHIRTAADPDEDILVLSPDCGFEPGAGTFQPIGDSAKGLASAQSLKFEFQCQENVKVRLEFFGDRIELKAEISGTVPAGDFNFELARGSKCYANRIFSPGLPDFELARNHYFRPVEKLTLSPGLTSPPPWVFALRENKNQWFGAALEPELSEFQFLSFGTTPGNDNALNFNVQYRTMPEHSEQLSIPLLVLRFGLNDEFEALKTHVQSIIDSGKFTPVKRTFPAWHSGISVCGWRMQGCSPKNCLQSFYEDHVRDLEAAGLDFDTIIIDGVWGTQHGLWRVNEENWPDLRGFVEARHSEDRHVLLWICTFADGLPENQCLPRCPGGWLHNIECEDFLLRLREDLRRMLSDAPGCYNADGVKFDFTSVLPTDYGKCSLRNVGFIYRFFEILHREIIAIKPEAVVLCQNFNPYFTPHMTMLRLNDYTALPENGFTEMRLRAQIAECISGGLPIDTDHVCYSQYSNDGAMDFFRHIGEYGCQSWYLRKSDLEDPELVDILRENTKKYLVRKSK